MTGSQLRDNAADLVAEVLAKNGTLGARRPLVGVGDGAATAIGYGPD